MKEKLEIKISVRNLVEFIMRSGDIDNRRGTASERDAMAAGAKVHRRIQNSMGGNYKAEVVLKKAFEFEDYKILIEGRADGIFTEDGNIFIDEIKGMYLDPYLLEKPFPVHLAQAKCYAYFYGEEKGLETIIVQMTYVNLEKEDLSIRRFQEEISMKNLREWFGHLLEKYQKWTDYQYQEKHKRQASIKKIEFPFPYREGQRDLAVGVYRTIKRRKTLFIQAPTGIGKTISAIFPAIKAIGEGLGDKLFYLTAKTITAGVAQETFDLLRKQGLHFKTVTITAKDKLCFQEERDCNPITCPYAKGHYDRVNMAVYDLLTQEKNIQREEIKKYAEKHSVCPFEMCLDTSNWVDGIICDYNYVFDPNVKLKRYFSDAVSGDYIFLIDEAHNLVERARTMYSATLYKEEFLDMQRLMKTVSRQLSQDAGRCNKNLLEWKRQCETYMILENAGAFVLNLVKLMGDIETFFQEHGNFKEAKKVSEFYLKIRHFLNIHELLDESYQIYTKHTEDEKFCICLFCVHTAHNLRQCLEKAKSSILFSATLLPIQYYRELLSNNPEDYAVYAASPFKKENRCILLGSDVSSKYTRRKESEYKKIYQHIENLVTSKIGNYMVFFPSYQLMQNIYTIFEMLPENVRKMEVFCQEANMKEEEKEEFLKRFEEKRRTISMVSFCVLGGIFSEGIDLIGEKLIGAVIVGTGLPQISIEQEILKNYFEEKEGNGFNYAYRYPGMNKILQAAGRVIRTKQDRGIILLLDSRFQELAYQELFPREWEDYKRVTINSEVKWIQEFWKKELE